MSMGADTWAVSADELLTPHEQLCPGWVMVRGTRIEAVGAGQPPAGVPTCGLGERILVPGFIDMHVHGGNGAQVNGSTAADVSESVHAISRFHLRHGTTGMLATTVSDTRAGLIATVRGIADAMDRPAAATAEVFGVHLEGPWIAPSRAGAQDPTRMRPPDTGELRELMGASRDQIRLITVAPELPGAFDLIRFAFAEGVTVSVGHTEADSQTTRLAFDAGARHMTHLFNAMPGIHHRVPGPVIAALNDPRISVEVIADAIHVHPEVLRLILSVAPDRVTAVTDAMPAAGLGPGRYKLGVLDVDVQEGRASLTSSPGTLAGSVLTMDRAIRVLVDAGTSLAIAVTSATATPARVLGASAKGQLTTGRDADMVVLDKDLSVAAAVIAGGPAYDPHRLFDSIITEMEEVQ